MLWRDVNAIYQIYPRSFLDTNTDGIGDLKGITSKLDYLKGHESSLGVDAIWLSPIFPSPMKDFGYDVSNYCDIDATFGDMSDFEELVAAAHKKEILVMLDFVPNHTSSQHPWFVEALSSLGSDRRDFYIFRDPKPDGSAPNNWRSVFGGSAWEYHEPTGQYYLHSFLKEQPDLNWQNPKVQEEIKKVLRFWFDKGVDGIRADAVRWMGKNTEFLDDPINDAYQEGQDPYHAVRHHYSRHSHELDTYLKIISSVAREYDNKIIIFEDHLDTLSPIESQVRRMYAIDPGVAAPFNFQAMHIPFNSRSFSSMINTYQSYIDEVGRAYYCFSNHDESRLATRFGHTQARMLAVLQLTLPGTPVLYFGQELGMEDGVIAPDKIQDPFEKRVPGKGLGRDPERTPMLWSAEHLAGFTTANQSWLPINQDYRESNVEVQRADELSSLNLYKRLLKLRSEHAALRDGVYDHGHTDDNVLMFWRHGEAERFLSVLNFSEHWVEVLVPVGGTMVVSAQNQPLATSTERVARVAPLNGLLIRYEI